MSRLPCLSFAGVLWTCLTGPAWGNAPTPPMMEDPTQAVNLVRQLGDHSFQTREQASRELLRLGLAAKEALLTGARDPDLEIRRRCRDLLPSILEADRRARLEAFIADKEGKQKHDLPGWERYRKMVGEDSAARELFVAVQRLDTGFLSDIDKDPDRAGEHCAVLCYQLYQKLYGGPWVPNRQLDPAELAPLLLVAADPRTQMPPQSRYLISNFFYQQPAKSALATAGSAFRKLALAWMARQTDDETACQQMFFMVGNLDLKEGVDLALKVIRDKKLKGPGLASALTTLGKLGGKEHAKALEGLLSNRTALGNFALNRQRGTTEMRDVALAMLVHLSGQDHKDYGFVFSQANPHLKFYPNFLGFTNNEQRTRAFAKWYERNAAMKK